MGSQWEGDTCAPSTLAATTTRSAVSLSSSPTAATISFIKSPRCLDAAASANATIVPRSRAPAFRLPLVHSRTSVSAPRTRDGSNERTSRLADADGLPANGGGSVAAASSDGDGSHPRVPRSSPEPPSASPSTFSAASFAAPTDSTSASAFTPFASTSSATPESRNGSSERACGRPQPSGKSGGESTNMSSTSSLSVPPAIPPRTPPGEFIPRGTDIHLASATWNAARTAGVLSQHSCRTPGASASATSPGDTKSKRASTQLRHACLTCECLCPRSGRAALIILGACLARVTIADGEGCPSFGWRSAATSASARAHDAFFTSWN
mmetsp:Transcript_5713/g.23487  ORF Transcript_5713/g.23487 Transcript_5713/m.23487 type:complete len:324 (+) Transcript_5713:1585-2556(+)